MKITLLNIVQKLVETDSLSLLHHRGVRSPKNIAYVIVSVAEYHDSSALRHSHSLGVS